MTNSMTGFGSREGIIRPFGKMSVELRSTNHKFLEVVVHLPEGFLPLEDRIKKEIEGRIKRGRVTCAINIPTGQTGKVFINRELLREYVQEINRIKKQFQIKDNISMDALINLPGALSLEASRIPLNSIWSCLKTLLNQALDSLVGMRLREGRALCVLLKTRARALKASLDFINKRYKVVAVSRVAKMQTEEERVNFLKDTDITEETDRLAFHIRSFSQKLSRNGPIGKELDFIAQEMQRETNTIGAKSCDALISSRVVNIKSQIEKIREQVQNVE